MSLDPTVGTPLLSPRNFSPPELKPEIHHFFSLRVVTGFRNLLGKLGYTGVCQSFVELLRYHSGRSSILSNGLA